MKKKLPLDMATGKKVYYDTDFMFFIPPKVGDDVTIEHDHKGNPHLKRIWKEIGGDWGSYYNHWDHYMMISANASPNDRHYISFITGLTK